jgi:Secreted and surface protein containing fasciclin-like repeats
VVIPDVKASNGVIHAIDAVLVPPSLSQPPAPTQSIVQIASGNPDFSTLVSLVQKAGLVEAISAPGPSPSSRRPTRRSRSSRRRHLRPTRPSSPTPRCSRRC